MHIEPTHDHLSSSDMYLRQLGERFITPDLIKEIAESLAMPIADVEAFIRSGKFH
jgi:hypothetical protein